MNLILTISSDRRTKIIIVNRNSRVHPIKIFKVIRARQSGRFRVAIIRITSQGLGAGALPSALLRQRQAQVTSSTASFHIGREGNRVRKGVLHRLMFSVRTRQFGAVQRLIKGQPSLRRQGAYVRANQVHVVHVIFLFNFLHYRVLRHMAIHRRILVAALSSFTILGRGNLVTMLLRQIRTIHRRGSHLNQVLLSLERRIITLTLRHLVASNGRLIRRGGITLNFSNRKRHRSRLRATKMVLRLLIRRLTRFNRLSSVIVRNNSFIANRTRRHAIRVRILASNRFKIRPRTGLSRQRRLTSSVRHTLFQRVGLKSSFRRNKFSKAVASSSTRRITLVRFRTSVTRRLLFNVTLGTLNPIRRNRLRTTNLFHQRARKFNSVISLRRSQAFVHRVYDHNNITDVSIVLGSDRRDASTGLTLYLQGA